MADEIIVTRAWLDSNRLTYDAAIENKELRDLTVWCDDNLCNGAALHIIIEDGNYDDDSVTFCLDYIKSGEWNKRCIEEDYSYTDDDNKKMLRVLELMAPLTEEYREMIMEGNTITDELFNFLYNQSIG